MTFCRNGDLEGVSEFKWDQTGWNGWPHYKRKDGWLEMQAQREEAVQSRAQGLASCYRHTPRTERWPAPNKQLARPEGFFPGYFRENSPANTWILDFH